MICLRINGVKIDRKIDIRFDIYQEKIRVVFSYFLTIPKSQIQSHGSKKKRMKMISLFLDKA